MATMKTRCENIIETIPSAVTDADLDQWVKDGAVDVIRRAINKDPLKVELFSKNYLTASSIGVDSKYGIVISATLGDYECDEVSYKLRKKIKDENSIHYRTEKNPCYYRESGKVFVYPYASSDVGVALTGASSVYEGDGTKFTCSSHTYTDGTTVFLNGLTTQNADDATPFQSKTVLVTDTAPGEFTVMIPYPASAITNEGYSFGFEAVIAMPIEPDGSFTHSAVMLESIDLHHESLVVLYMAQRCLFHGMASIAMTGNSMDAFPIQPSAPESPDFTDIESITFEDSGMIYQEGTAGTTGADVDSSSNSVDWADMTGTITAPTYSGPVVFPDYSAANAFLDEEDVELVQSKLNIIQTELQEYQGSIQEALNKFNKENVVYQSKVQANLAWYRSIAGKRVDSKPFSATSDRKAEVSVQASSKEAELKFQKDVQEYANKLGKYQAEIGSWQQEVNRILQEYSAKIQGDNTEYQWYAGKYSMLRKEYLEGF